MSDRLTNRTALSPPLSLTYTDELAEVNSLQNLFDDVMTDTNTTIGLRMTCKSNSKLRNPLVNVIGSLEGIELAKERILAIFENIKMRVVLKMDVSYKDHSHIIGRGGFSIQRVMDETGSHCHFPDSNRISEVKKSNVVLLCGSPTGVEQARCQIRNLLPLVIHFKIPVEYLKIEYLKRGTSSKLVESYSKHLRPITQAYNVHISIRNSHDIDEAYAAIFDSSNASEYIAVSVRGANSDLVKLKESLNVLISRLTNFNTNLDIDYVLTIEITEIYHQVVMGNNFYNIKGIMQQTGCRISFPEIEANQRAYDFDNLNEIPVNKSTVIIKGKSFEAVHTAWKELIGFLPLVLTFDVPHDHPLDTGLINQLKKQYKVAIFPRHKEKFNTVTIRGIEKNSRVLFEVRKQLLKLDDAEIPICCNQHAASILESKFFGHCIDENGNSTLARNENTTGILNSLVNQNGFHSPSANSGLNLLNGNSASNILNTKMMHSIDSNNNLPNLNDKASFINQLNLSSSERLPHNIDPVLFQRMFQGRLLQFQLNQLNQRTTTGNKQQSIPQQSFNNSMFNNNQLTALNLTNANLNDEEVHKLFRQQQGLIDPSLRNTQSVSDIQSLHTNHQIFQNDSLHHALKKEHLTSSCSSPSLHAMVQNNSSLLNQNSHNFSMNTSNLNSTGNNTSSSNATASTANNSFNSNGLTSSPPANCNSSFSSLVNNQQSPIQSTAKNINWLDQRRQLPYDECRLLALKKTFEKPDSNEVRIPSAVWSGLGFSKSMSHDTLRSNRLNEWNGSMFNTPSGLNGDNGNTAGCLGLDDIQKQTNTMNKMNQLVSTDATDFAWPEIVNQNSIASKQRALIKQESEICSSTHPYSSSYLNSLMNGENQGHLANFSTGQYLSNNNDRAAPNGNQHQLDTFIDVNKIDLSTVLLEFGLVKFVEIFKQYKIDFAQFLSLTEDDLIRLGIQYVGRRKVYSAIIEMRKLLQSNYVGNNFSKSTEDLKQQDELTAAINKQLKSFSASIEQEHDESPTSAKVLNDNLTKKFGIFGDYDLSNINDFENDPTTSSRSVDAIGNAFDSMKLGECNEISKQYSMNDQITNLSEITSTNENFDLNLNVNGDVLDDQSSKSANYSTNEDKTNVNAENVDEDYEKNRVSNSQDLVNHAGSVEEVAQA